MHRYTERHRNRETETEERRRGSGHGEVEAERDIEKKTGRDGHTPVISLSLEPMSPD